ncbi:MAG: DegT/DnrJ/EryC1/StrS family aminotransferase [Armatimonadota bacterium]|nr:DegT/DnrJ/EryC1/StrS family aminotransferase [Armatimonadota bacterium]MDR7479491.1 DegT/DnrJ/EryC1/StrS family aminotransferase [Armatimonadota bacterium]MDR7526646.1 DegT/DnrJ/EryC1/StrS family aminotransferase [Armatimonadota bacterium]MDR7543919.1 DegT/DnrJ/EryC1/StrS family aminotransferase [Armatimonadota bacterium]MDR7573969.1 DegT/DnrJ/EryC1/StrS family aminotransferase [Armatimonadota bacterium]
MGEKVKQFERLFAAYLGVRHAVMVNSGSSANLIALSLLSHPELANHLRAGDEVIVPAVPWSTTVFPVLQVGAIPVFVDVDLETFNISIEEIEKAITPRTRAVIVVHLLGRPVDMDAVLAVAQEHGLFVIEDACEAPGAMVHGRKVGTFGDVATFSFFFSHHISTIEGGLVVTNNDDFADLARSLRAHGWVREMIAREAWAARCPDFDPRFLFVTAGYNFRPTEIQGAFGIHQMEKLEAYIEIRRANAAYWRDHLSPYQDRLAIADEHAGGRHVWFSYPLRILPGAGFGRRELARALEANGIETRPIMAGNMAAQPVMRLYGHRRVGALSNAAEIGRNALLFGNHHGVTEEDRAYIVSCITSFLRHR